MPRPGDPDLVERFTSALANGHPVATAATMAGISERTAHDWIQQGNEELDALEDVAEPEPRELGSHAQFALATQRALAAFVEDNLGVLNAAKGPEGKSWVPALALLKARRPKDFGDRQYSFIETKTEIAVTFSVEALSPARQRALAELALKSLPPGEVIEGEVVGDA